MWTWTFHQYPSRSCRHWVNLPSPSRIWLTAACLSCIWKWGMTQISTGHCGVRTPPDMSGAVSGCMADHHSLQFLLLILCPVVSMMFSSIQCPCRMWAYAGPWVWRLKGCVAYVDLCVHTNHVRDLKVSQLAIFAKLQFPLKLKIAVSTIDVMEKSWVICAISVTY